MRWPATASVDGAAVDLEAAHLALRPPRGQDHELVADRERARDERAGDDGAEALHGEHAVDGSRGGRRRSRRARREPAAASAARSSGRPVAGRRADAGTIGASARKVPASARADVRSRRARASRRRRGRAWSATTRPRRTPSSWQMSRCSRVCGITPSSAATTSRHEVDAARAGDHGLDEALVARHVDDRDRGRRRGSRCAKPSSIVMPRSFSSLSRSVSMPVSALDQRRLAVIDVPGGADDDVSHCGC